MSTVSTESAVYSAVLPPSLMVFLFIILNRSILNIVPKRKQTNTPRLSSGRSTWKNILSVKDDLAREGISDYEPIIKNMISKDYSDQHHKNCKCYKITLEGKESPTCQAGQHFSSDGNNRRVISDHLKSSNFDPLAGWSGLIFKHLE